MFRAQACVYTSVQRPETDSGHVCACRCMHGTERGNLHVSAYACRAHRESVSSECRSLQRVEDGIGHVSTGDFRRQRGACVYRCPQRIKSAVGMSAGACRCPQWEVGCVNRCLQRPETGHAHVTAVDI